MLEYHLSHIHEIYYNIDIGIIICLKKEVIITMPTIKLVPVPEYRQTITHELVEESTCEEIYTAPCNCYVKIIPTTRGYWNHNVFINHEATGVRLASSGNNTDIQVNVINYTAAISQFVSTGTQYSYCQAVMIIMKEGDVLGVDSRQYPSEKHEIKLHIYY